MKKKKIDLSGYSDGPIDDPDNPELTREMIRRMRPLRENPELLKRLQEASENLRRRKARGEDRSTLGRPEKQIARAEEDVADAFKEDSPVWHGSNEELKNKAKMRRKR